ncbi:CopD family protein [Deinococcus sp. VB142]|uniref:CopD family protein n=1 Tax=Deinococcus sp. VB142 TaxID=3112952 RepID=A0AAU6Q7H6_9DEIO
MSRLLLLTGLALLLGGGAARRLLAAGEVNPVRLRWLLLGWALLFLGAGLSVYQPLRELGLLAPADVLDYLTGVGAGRAALLLLLCATLFLLVEVWHWPALMLVGLGGWALWGLAGIGHGGIHGGTVRGLHALHAGAMSIWVGGLAALLRWPAPSRRAAAQRFSPIAAGCVALLTLTGLGMGLNHIPTLDALRQSEYGQTLLLKLLAFAGVLAAAGWVRRSLMRDWALLRTSEESARMYSASPNPAFSSPRSARKNSLGIQTIFRSRMTQEKLAALWPELLLLALVLLLTARLGGLPLVHGV